MPRRAIAVVIALGMGACASLAGAAASAADAGLFFDFEDDDLARWDVRSFRAGQQPSARIANEASGNAFLEIGRPDIVRVTAWLKDRRFGDFVLEADVRKSPEHEASWAGVGIRGGYLIYLKRHFGEVHFYGGPGNRKHANAGFLAYEDERTREELARVRLFFDEVNTRFHRLKVVCAGPVGRVYVDGVLVYELSGLATNAARVGLFGHVGTAHFDNVKITTDVPPAQFVVAAPDARERFPSARAGQDTLLPFRVSNGSAFEADVVLTAEIKSWSGDAIANARVSTTVGGDQSVPVELNLGEVEEGFYAMAWETTVDGRSLGRVDWAPCTIQEEDAMRITVEKHERQTLYVSPQKPPYTAWVRLFTMAEESIIASFTQATGPADGRDPAPPQVRESLGWPPPNRPKYDMTGLTLENVYLRSTDRGKTWSKVSADAFATCMNAAVRPGGEVALADGTVLRAVWGQYLPYDDVPRTGYIQRSTDEMATWGPPELLTDDPHLLASPGRLRVLRDGRIAVAGAVTSCDIRKWNREKHKGQIRPCLWVSHDEQGKSWSDPLYVVTDPTQTHLTEEWDLAELPNGDLFCLYRVHQPGIGRLQNVLVKDGNTWAPMPTETAPLKQTGFPELLMTREGVVLYLATDGIWATNDRGRRWSNLNTPGTGYYPSAVQLEDGTILSVAHHGGGDSPYGANLSIVMDTYRIRVSGADAGISLPK